MYTDKISLVDGLKHHNYSWPKTFISYPVVLNTDKEQLNSFYLLNDKGEQVSCQIYEAQEIPEGGVNAKLCFVADMPSGAEHSYSIAWEKQSDVVGEDILKVYDSSEETILLSTREIMLKICRDFTGNDFGKCRIFSMESLQHGITGNAYLSTTKKLLSYTISIPNHGRVFVDCFIEIKFEDGSSYELKLRITEGVEFIEIQEEIQGFGEDEKTELLVEWDKFYPEKRYAQYREEEKIDQYNREECMPFKLLPYSSWVSWWGTKTAAFTDSKKGISAGVFVRNVEKWNDGKFSLWGFNESMAVRFRYGKTWDLESRLVWEYPLVDGMRCTAVALYDCRKDNEVEQKSYIDALWFWQEFLNLDKVKNWILRWDENKKEYPRFFSEDRIPEPGVTVWHYGLRKEPFSPAFMEDMVYHLSHNMNQLYNAGAVSCREFFSWVYVFDMAAPKMSQQQFDDLKACCAFMAYANVDENFMPIGNMLAGHPNFLADVRSVPALMASIFPNHPHAGKWVEQFERAMALNLKYHVRPEVKAWESKGGRWTENLGCYNYASLIPMMKTGALVYKAFGDNILMVPNLVNWTEWMLNSFSAPVNGKRTTPPQGAHSGHYLDPLVPISPLRFLSDRLFKYHPMLSEYLMYICKPDAPSHEERIPNSNIYKCLMDDKLKENCGTQPLLESSKYTGYGYVLRSSVGEESEVSVHLQQIDEGPNYRWGRAGQGGCGVIYYYAAGKRYSYNRPEDVGDANMGDVQACCNFGILHGHEYRSVGRNDITEPLYDFGFAQYAQVNAGDYSQPFYTSRSVILSGNDYIIIYDQVGDLRVRGRFAWFVKESEQFPNIVQLKPGAKGVEAGPGIPIEATMDRTINPGNQSKGLQFDGSGDFLTIVTHRSLNCDYNTYTKKTEYGAEISLQGRTDRIFRDGSLIRQEDAKTCFTGYAGIIRLYGSYKAEAALFKGNRIGALGVEVLLLPQENGSNGSAGISFVVEKGRLIGKATCAKPTKVRVCYKENTEPDSFKLYIDAEIHDFSRAEGDSFTFLLPQGTHTWQWTDACPVPQAAEIVSTSVMSGSVEVHWKECNGAEGYDIEISRDCGKNWSSVLDVGCVTTCRINGLENGVKVHLRMRGFNQDSKGKWSHDYPVYITDQVPEAPEGLKVWRAGDAFRILWGWQLGVSRYRLYKREKDIGDFRLIYEGSSCEFTDLETNAGIAEYAVSAVNGNGEGVKSLSRDTAPGGLADWDPQPDIAFRRYTKSHEYGFNGFDHWSNTAKGELKYPEDRAK